MYSPPAALNTLNRSLKSGFAGIVSLEQNGFLDHFPSGRKTPLATGGPPEFLIELSLVVRAPATKIFNHHTHLLILTNNGMKGNV